MNPADQMLVSFKSHLRVETVPAEAVCLFSERDVTVLSGPSIERLAPMLDGTRSVPQIERELSPDLSAAALAELITRLSDAGLISFRQAGDADQADDGSRTYWSLAGIEADRAASAVARSAVEIIAVGNAGQGAAAACRASGLTVHEPGHGPAAISLVLCDDYLDPALAGVNADHLASGRPWLLAKPSGTTAWLGPVFQPGAGPCWACLARRVKGNRLGGSLLRLDPALRPAMPPPAALPASRTAALQLAVLEITKWLAGVRCGAQQDIYALDTLTLHGGRHPVGRRPQCRACGDPGLVAAQTRRPVTLAARRAAAMEGNGQRTLPAATTLERHAHLVDPVTGVVAELRPNPGCPPFMHSYVSGRNRAMNASTVTALRAGLRSNSGGKGVNQSEAMAGALCEAVERYSATCDGDELTITDSYRNLDEAVHPDTCQLFHQRQFADRARWNATCMPFHVVPEPFDETSVIEWTPVWSLLTGQRKLLPTALLYFAPRPPRGPAFTWADSNGGAAGSSLEDAVLQGAMELVERDAVALWWYNRTRHPSVRLDTFDDDWIASLPGRLANMNREVWVLDLTSDLGIPVMAAISRRTDKPAEDIVFGFGAHFDPHIAMRRALTELGQMLCAVAGVRRDGTGYALNNPHLMAWWTGVSVASQPYLLPDPSQPPQAAATYGYRAPEHLDVDRISAVVRKAGLDLLVLNQTRPDIGIPVVKVIVPGLRHFWPRFAPGRLYDVPVLLGRLAEPTAYERLNPIPVYL